MEKKINCIIHGDCIKQMRGLEGESVHLAFADPPFNIGYDYDVYDDSRDDDEYVGWSHKWISEVFRILKSDGTFWLAIGDDYAAELKIASQKIGFHCRSWVIWYYTFGVNCKKKFSRSHTHLFHFVKDPKNFTFNDGAGRVPSARQLVYNDNRANSGGRLPDDTWVIPCQNTVGELTPDECLPGVDWTDHPSDIGQTFTLRPQDLSECFGDDENTWYFPRVAGTFKERAGFHGCQMPEQLLGRIIRICSNENDIVVDPFSGSATSLVVAKKQCRRFIGFELSEDYVRYGRERLNSARIGDPLEGSPEPLISAPRTSEDRNDKKKGDKNSRKIRIIAPGDHDSYEAHCSESRRSLIQSQTLFTEAGVLEAFRQSHDGHSADRVVADPKFNEAFVLSCEAMGLEGNAYAWNTILFRLRKRGKTSHIATTKKTVFSWDECDSYLFASEIALQRMLSGDGVASLDHILCDPELAEEFDQLGRELVPGLKSLQLRWAALKLRKQAKMARIRGDTLPLPKFDKAVRIDELDVAIAKYRDHSGVYVVLNGDGRNPKKFYAGEALNLGERLELLFKNRKYWMDRHLNWIRAAKVDTRTAGILAWQSRLVKKFSPRWNFQELRVGA